jgi:hypothetical protein
MPSNKVFRITEAEYRRLRDEDSGGICLACGNIIDSDIEPDAEGYKCDACGKNELYGIELALLMGRIEIT